MGWRRGVSVCVRKQVGHSRGGRLTIDNCDGREVKLTLRLWWLSSTARTKGAWPSVWGGGAGRVGIVSWLLARSGAVRGLLCAAVICAPYAMSIQIAKCYSGSSITGSWRVIE